MSRTFPSPFILAHSAQIQHGHTILPGFRKTRPNKFGPKTQQLVIKPLHQIFDKATKENGLGLPSSFGGLKKG